jgi:hypothetical protein
VPWTGRLLATIWTVALLALAGGEAAAWDSSRRAAAEVQRAGAELAELSGHPFAPAVQGEIALLESWIEETRGALAARKARKAAMLAERLPRQLALIRALLALAEDEARALELEAEAGRLRDELAALGGRLERRASGRSGGSATWAYPPLAPGEGVP